MSQLPAVPVIDVRDGGPLALAVREAAQARALRDDCMGYFPGFAAPLLPLLDGLARRWLLRSRSPYLPEITQIAASLGFSGVWLLNGSYQWGCTALAREEAGLPWLARTLDWPFPGLGRHVEVAHQKGQAGDFFNVTWPGYVGALTAMAPRRFGASINQAPLWRRTRHPWLRLYDVAANALRTWGLRHIPPDQLLRQVFETCKDFDAARQMLETTPIARPVIFTLVGISPGHRCVIERTEQGFETRWQETVAANDWLLRREPWEARVGGDKLLTASYQDAGGNSILRRQSLDSFNGSMENDSFGWVVEPVLNRFTRLAVEMCPARGVLRVIGYDNVGEAVLAQRVTSVREIGLMADAA